MTKLITHALIKQSIPISIRKKLSKEQYFIIEIALIKHLLQITSCKQYSTELKPFLKTPIIKILRNKMIGNFDFIIRLKFALMEVIKRRLTADNPKTAQIFTAYHLENHYYFVDVLHQQRLFGKAFKIAKAAKLAFKNEQDIRNECSIMLEIIDSYVCKFAHRKLTFVAKSNNIGIREIIDDLKEKAVSSYYMLIPFLSKEHTINAVKRAVHNEGINSIKFYTAAKRSRLNSDGYGSFSNTIVTMNFASKEEDGENPTVFKNVHDPQFRRLNLKLSLQSIMRTHGRHPRKRKVLKLIQMESDPSFSKDAYKLYPTMLRPTNSTEEIFDRLGRTHFLEAVRTHVGSKPEAFDKFIHEIQRLV